ncbi:uncharacterized protein LOC124151453 [Haliotis rufescens]|uniref:uncharacterized protein LOC124151453 n=1 Tax=Haliotis rufescens TaxID=6454 RepID=UPI00201EA56E|nr:uncharacterized protein LOC124151453 [Haliotis rufescens]
MSEGSSTRPVPLEAPPQHTCMSTYLECALKHPQQQGEDDISEECSCLYSGAGAMGVVPSSSTETTATESQSSAFLSDGNNSTGSSVFLSDGSGENSFLSQVESSFEGGQYFSSPGTESPVSFEDDGRDGPWSPTFVHTARLTNQVSSGDISDVSSIYPLSPSNETAAISNTSECDEDGHSATLKTDKTNGVPDCNSIVNERLVEEANIQEEKGQTGSSFHSLQSNISSIVEKRKRFQDPENWSPSLSLSLSFCDTSSIDEICDFESIVPMHDEDILSLSELCANSEETHIVTFNRESQKRSPLQGVCLEECHVQNRDNPVTREYSNSMIVATSVGPLYSLPDNYSTKSIETYPSLTNVFDKPSYESLSKDRNFVKVEHTCKTEGPYQTLSKERGTSFRSSKLADTGSPIQQFQKCIHETSHPPTGEHCLTSYDINTSGIISRGICSQKENSSTHSSSPHTIEDVSPHMSYSGGFKSSRQPQLSKVAIIDHMACELAKTAIALSLQETASEIQGNAVNSMLHPLDEQGTKYKTSLSEQILGAVEQHKTSSEDNIGLAKPPLKSTWMKNAINRFESWSDFKSCIDIPSTIGDTHGEKFEQAVDADEAHSSEIDKVDSNVLHEDRLIPTVQQSKVINHNEMGSLGGLRAHYDNICAKVSLHVDESAVEEVNRHPTVKHPISITENQTAEQLEDNTKHVLPATDHNIVCESPHLDGDEESVLQPTSTFSLPTIPKKAVPLVNMNNHDPGHKRILAFHSSPNTILCEIDGKERHPKIFATYERLVPTEGHCDELSGSEDYHMVEVTDSREIHCFWKRRKKNKACPKREQLNFFNKVGSMEYAVYILPNNGTVLQNRNSHSVADAYYDSVFADEKSGQHSHNASEELCRKTVSIGYIDNKRAKRKKGKGSPKKPCNGSVVKYGDVQNVMSRHTDNGVQVHSGKWNNKYVPKKLSSTGLISTASGTGVGSDQTKGKHCDLGNRDLSVIKGATDEQLCEIVAEYTKNYITGVLTGITSLAEKGNEHNKQTRSEKHQLSKKRLHIDLREKIGDVIHHPSHQLDLSDEHSVGGNLPLEPSQECNIMEESDCKKLPTEESIPSLTSNSIITGNNATMYSANHKFTCCLNDRLLHHTASAFVAAMVLSEKCENFADRILEKAEQELATYMMHNLKEQMSMSLSKPLPALYSGSEIREGITAAAKSVIQKAFCELQIKLDDVGLTGKNYGQKQDSMYKLEAYKIATSCIWGAMHECDFQSLLVNIVTSSNVSETEKCPMPELSQSHRSGSNIRNSTIGICCSRPHPTDHVSQTYISSQLSNQLSSSIHSLPATADVSQLPHLHGDTKSVSAKEHELQTRQMCPFSLQPHADYERYKMLVEPSKYPLRSSRGQAESDIDKCILAENHNGPMKETLYFDTNNTKPLQERYASQYYSRRIQCALCKKQK